MEAEEESQDVNPLQRNVKDGIALCLSGGGYRAMLFHVGVLWRLNEIGFLQKVDRVSSVSGGSITGGMLGLNWPKLGFNSVGVAEHFVSRIVEPIRTMAESTIDVTAVVSGALLPFTSISDRVVSAYRRRLFGDATLQDLPDQPRFVFNATNLQSGSLWRFSKPYMADYRVGMIDHPKVPLAVAVAASSAFPPILSPLEMEVGPEDAKDLKGADLHRKPYTTEVVLADGGVYDNMGLETVLKRYRTVLVSDAGQKTQAEEDPDSNWVGQCIRVLDLIDNQVRSLRKRNLIWLFQKKIRKGSYWGIRTDINNYRISDALSCPLSRTQELAEIPTRLKALDTVLQERLINWGYAVCDSAMRSHVTPLAEKPTDFPYPTTRV
jgi:NTE family protein